MDNQTKDMQIFSKSLEELKSAGIILTENQNRTTLALSKAEQVKNALPVVEQMTSDHDTYLKEFIKKMETAHKEMNDKRAPITQLLNTLRDKYVDCENLLKEKIAELKGIRNKFAAHQANVAEIKRKEALKKEAKIKEHGHYKAMAYQCINDFVIQEIADRKRRMTAYFEEAKLEDIDDRITQLRAQQFVLSSVSKCIVNVPVVYLSSEEMAALRQEVEEEYFPGWVATWKESLDLHRNSIFDRVETKRKALMAIKNASHDEEVVQDIVLKETERQQLEASQLAEQTQSAKEAGASKSRAILERTATLAMFETATQIADDVKKPSGHEIIVKHPGAYNLMFTLWFNNVGKNMVSEELDKVKLLQIKKWCADHMHKGGEKIDSEFLDYMPIYKASR